MNLMLTVILLGNLTATSYRSVLNQTDDTPFITATGDHVSVQGVALSQDLLCGACLKLHKRCAHPENQMGTHYGDVVYIDLVGFRIVNDCMGEYKHYSVITKTGKKRLKMKQLNWVDVWVPQLKDEQEFHKKFKGQKLKVWMVKAV